MNSTIVYPPPAVTVIVHGKPAPQGSKTRGRFGMWDDNKATLHPWRAAVTEAARSYSSPLHGPLCAEVTFTLPKPAAAPKTRVSWPCKRRSGDVDKLLRAVFDSLTDAGVWDDDAQVVEVTARKCYPNEGIDSLTSPGVMVKVWRLSEVTT